MDRKFLAMLGLFGLMIGFPASLSAQPMPAKEDPLYVLPDKTIGRFTIRDGKFGKIAQLQQAIKLRLTEVDPKLGDAFVVDGIVGKGTAAAIRMLISRPNSGLRVPDPNSDLQVTQEIWRFFMGESEPPSVEERIETWVLTYEATPFERVAEWNFCQRNGNRTRRLPPCQTNDDSLLTWGPRGATAAAGREVQAVILELERANPNLVEHAFGNQYDSLKRSLALSSVPPTRVPPVGRYRAIDNVSDLELYLCPIWLDENRSRQWAQAFSTLGSQKQTQDIYMRLYRSLSFDGSKMRQFFTLYAKLGVEPSELDFAFFTDRSTHTGGIANLVSAETAVRSKLGVGPWKNWQVRQAISQQFRAGTQITDRLGRDVAFYIDGVGAKGLSVEELAAWKSRSVGLSGLTFGLSDSRPSPKLITDQTAWPTVSNPKVVLSKGERSGLGCPDWIINRQKIRG